MSWHDIISILFSTFAPSALGMTVNDLELVPSEAVSSALFLFLFSRASFAISNTRWPIPFFSKFTVMAEEIDLLKEQLRVKDKQIERLQGIIENLTKEEEPKPDKAPEPHIPDFWERHVKLSYTVFWALMVVGIAVTISPWWCKPLWELAENSFGLLYIFTLMSLVAVCFLSWFHTPRGRRWLKEL